MNSARKINLSTNAIAILVALTALLGSYVTGRLGADSATKNTAATLRGQSNQARCDTLRSQRLSAYHEYFAAAQPEQSAEWAMYLMVTSPNVDDQDHRYAQPDPAEFDAQLKKAAIGIGAVKVHWLYARVISTSDVQAAGDALSDDFNLNPFFTLDVSLHTSVTPEEWDDAVETFMKDISSYDKPFDVFTTAVAQELNARCQ